MVHAKQMHPMSTIARADGPCLKRTRPRTRLGGRAHNSGHLNGLIYSRPSCPQWAVPCSSECWHHSWPLLCDAIV